MQFLRGSDVSKESKGSVSFSFATNSRNANIKSLGLTTAASSKKNIGFPADRYSETDDTLLRKSTTVRGQDHPTTDSDLPAGSIVEAETLSTDLSRIADTLLNDEDDTDLDLDSPTEGFSSIADAIEDIRQGKVSTSCNLLFDTLMDYLLLSIFLTKFVTATWYFPDIGLFL